MILFDIPMTDVVIKGTTVKRRLLTTEVEFTKLSFKDKVLVMIVPVLNYTEVTTQNENEVYDPETDTTVSTLVDVVEELPYQIGIYQNSKGIEYYEVTATNNKILDMTTGLRAEVGVEDIYKVGEFDYFRMLLQSVDDGGQGIALEDIMLSILSRNIQNGWFEDDTFRVKLKL